MKKSGSCRFSFGFLALCSVLLASTALAQNIYDEETAKIIREGMSQDQRNLDPKARRLEPSPEGLRLRSKAEGLSELQAGDRRHGTTIYSPMAGLSDTLSSQAYADQISMMLGSPMVILNTTLLLTEPAVAGGMQNSLAQGNASLTNRYLAEQHFKQQLEAHPETKQIMLRAYDECVANLIRLRSNTPGTPDADQDAIGWIEAQSQCMADRINSIGSIGGTNFERITSGSATTGRGFDFMMDPANPQWQGSAPANEFTINLTDYLFNNSNYALAGVNLDDLKQSFIQLLGDVEFRVDDISSASNGRSASRELKYTKLPAGNTRDLWLLDKETKIYQSIMALLQRQCSHTSNDESTFNSGSFAGTLTPTDFEGISVVGYEFDAAMLDMIYNNFANNGYPEVAYAPANRDCAIFGTAYDPANMGGKGGAIGNVVYLAQELAVARAYLALGQIYIVVQNNVSANSYFAKSFAEQLIMDFAGTLDLKSSYNRIIQNIQDSFRINIQNNSAIQGSGAAGKVRPNLPARAR